MAFGSDAALPDTSRAFRREYARPQADCGRALLFYLFPGVPLWINLSAIQDKIFIRRKNLFATRDAKPVECSPCFSKQETRLHRSNLEVLRLSHHCRSAIPH